MSTHLPNRITEVRKARNMTLEQLSSITGISIAMLSRMARSLRPVSVDRLSKIAVALGVPTAELLPGEPVSRPLPLKDAMDAKGLSTYDLARATGISQSAVHDITRGLRAFSKHEPAIRKALGLPVTTIEARMQDVLERIVAAHAGATYAFEMNDIAAEAADLLAAIKQQEAA